MNEQIKKFDELYAKMSASTNVDDMKLFGKVMREAILFLSERVPEKAEELIDKLCAIKWKNYLTKREADEIVSKMAPQPGMTKTQINTMLDDMGMPREEMPYYNEHALYAEICKVFSDSGETLAKYAFGDNVIGATEMFELVYHLALDKLKDKDGVYNIRKYFGLW